MASHRQKITHLLEKYFMERFPFFLQSSAKTEADIIVDYLFENRAIILPCRIGDTVYCHKTLCDGKNTIVIEEDMVRGFNIDCIETTAIISYNHEISCDNFGKTIFLTRKEAEEALMKQKTAIT